MMSARGFSLIALRMAWRLLAAAEAVLSTLKNDAIYERLEERTVQLVEGLLALADRFGRPMTINRLGSVFSISMGAGAVTGKSSWEGSDREGYRRLVTGLLDEGVLFPAAPSSPALELPHWPTTRRPGR